jgi:hypothetical protein
MVTIDDTNIECTDRFVDYSVVDKHSRPTLLLGFRTKTVYDADRIKIKPEYGPDRIKHLTQHFDGTNEWCCMYGLTIPIEPNVKHLYHTLITIPTPTAEMYRDILKMHGFSCDQNFLLLRKNMIVLDVKCLSDASKNTKFNTFHALREMLVSQPKYPWYSNWVDFKLFLLL